MRNRTLYVLYRAEDNSASMQIGMHTSRLGFAASTDGLHFTLLPERVFFRANDTQKSREWPGGVEDPRLVEAADGTYILTYTQWNRHTYSIGIATSPDLVYWTKHGPALNGGASGRYDHLQYKSGGILTTVAPPLASPTASSPPGSIGEFWMYRGEITVHLATSPALIHWKPIEDPATHQPHRSPHEAPRPFRLRLPRGQPATRSPGQAHRRPLQRQEQSHRW